MAEYQVIARKWRPRCFADVVGQEHVIQTLKNEIRQNRLAHAYLFVGTRGIGKTTTARIFAKAVNCENPRDGEPCCECASCQAIANDNSLDVIEIDAASRNSVESMRALSEEAQHMPVASKYKVYIIDEVHMLTKQAWNALLKTIEEPPAHVKFIFATTEVHQVLPTIISRCQRFDLQPISSRLIYERLRLIAHTEKVKISDSALHAISRAADGGMRDAQSLLDQMIAFFCGDGEHEINENEVLSLFGLAGAEEIDNILGAIFINNPGQVVLTINQLALRGRNMETFLGEIIAALRNVQLCFILKNPNEVINETPEGLARFQRLAGNTNLNVVQMVLENLANQARFLRDALNKSIFLETVILRAMREAHSIRLDDVLRRLNQLRKADELKFLDMIPPDGILDGRNSADLILPGQTAGGLKNPVPTVVAADRSVSPVVSVAGAGKPLDLDKLEIEVVNLSDANKVLDKISGSEIYSGRADEVLAAAAAGNKLSFDASGAKVVEKEEVVPPPENNTAGQVDSSIEFSAEPRMVEPPENMSEMASNILPQSEIAPELPRNNDFPVLPESSPEEAEASDGENIVKAELGEIEPLTENEDEAVAPAGPEVDFVDEAAEYADVNGDIDLSVLGGELSEEEELNMMGNDSPAMDLPLDSGGDVAAELVGTRNNLMGDQAAMQQAKQNPLVAKVVDLFAGEIVDIHG
ncbi:MAG: DNA polymerase III subunit gamma/tau [Lentisphaeria bacterium]|nr:DNA polymerase III subunit gamma/tau [Lentisphaeria bacterium]